MSDTVLSIEWVGKTFGSTRVLEIDDLQIARGEIHAILGENGSGKSTLIKVLAGYHRPDPGSTVRVHDRTLSWKDAGASYAAGLRFVHQTLGLIESLSITDNLMLGSGFPTRLGTVADARSRDIARDLLSRAGLDIDPRTVISDLSPAERTGVAIARALRDTTAKTSPTMTVLVLDEPTATLPDAEVRRLHGIVRAVSRNGCAVIYVTHRLDEVLTLADRATILRDGKKIITTDVAGLTHAKLLNYLLGYDLADVRRQADALVADDRQPVLQISSLGSRRFVDVTLNVARGEIVGVAGLTGSGREDLCAAVFGAQRCFGGQVTVDGSLIPRNSPRASVRRGMAYIPANRARDGIFPELTSRENLAITSVSTLWRFPWLRRRNEMAIVRSMFEQLSINPPKGWGAKAILLSGGNQQKLVFGKWLQVRPRVYLLDEPTQGVDVGTKAFLHERLIRAAAQGAAVLISSSDADELTAICDRVIVMRGGRVATTLQGSEITVAAVAHSSMLEESA
jgi:ribose transport system ATP-binding protein